MTKRGKLIVIYGINNLGKTTQAELLAERISRDIGGAIYLKYPLYDLEPSGPIINAYLRPNKFPGVLPEDMPKLSPREFQILQILNRTQFQPTLERWLEKGDYVVAEDYKGTGIAWGMGAGVNKDFQVMLNLYLTAEDIIFLFDGKRFDDGRERGHTHEEDDKLTEKVRLAHLELAKDFDWRIVRANRPDLSKEESIRVIHEEIWDIVEPLLR